MQWLAHLRKKYFFSQLFSKVFLLQTSLIMIALVGLGFTARYYFKKQFLIQVEEQLHDTLLSLTFDMPKVISPEWCKQKSTDTKFRFTALKTNGEVLCDSVKDLQYMDNHLSRPEIIQAQKTGYGHNLRISRTFSNGVIYAAILIKERDLILRSGIPIDNLTILLQTFDSILAITTFAIAVALSSFSIWSTRKILLPIGALESSVEDLKKDLESQKANLQLQSEEHAALMSAVSDAVLAVDLEGIPLFYNSRFALLLGKGQTIRGKHIDKLLNDAILVHAFKEALTTGKVSSVNALPMDTETGKYFFSVSVSPLARKNGQVYGAIGIFYDVTELKRAEQIRINFVANVSHELRTPLTAIKGFTDTLIQDQQNGRPIENEFLQIIARNTGRLMNLINDLLDLSAIESNEIANKALIKTEEVTKAIIQQIKPSFDSKKQTISVNILAPNVMADQQRLEQVLVNLLANANKYTQPMGNVTVSWEYGKNQSVLLKVTDDGPGISVENQTRLFERFYRVDKSRSREQGGTGLGLAIVKHIMQSHGGSVHIESPAPGGSSFVCVFPA